MRFGLLRFIAIFVGGCACAYWALSLGAKLFRGLFGRAVPLQLIGLLMALCFLVCLAHWLYRMAYEGLPAESGEIPIGFEEAKGKLQVASLISFLTVLAVLWHGESSLFGLLWILFYLGAMEFFLTYLAHGRLVRYRIAQAKNWFPDWAERDQLRRAKLWADSGKNPAQFELDNSSGRLAK